MEQRVYRVITRKLRVQRGPGRADLVVARPFRGGKDGGYLYTDSDEKPTLVTFDEYCQVDIPSLLALGAIVEWPPAVSRETAGPKGKERAHG